MIIETANESETVSAGMELAKKLRSGDVVALYGGLGAGKTAFVRGLARGLGLDARVSSPTFTIVNEYLGAVPLFHFDMYRLSDPEELFEIGWEDYLNRNGICAVEWSENAGDEMPGNAVKVLIEKTGDERRRIVITRADGSVEL